MFSRTLRGWLKCLACGLVILSGAELCSAAGPKYQGITRPSKMVILAFDRPGRISEVTVKDGDTVKVGQVLARLDDAEEKINLAKLKTEADKVMHVDAAIAELGQKKVDLARVREAAKAGAATELEVEHAKLAVKIGDMKVALAHLEQKQRVLEYERERVRLDRMKLKSPIDGKVEQRFLSEGESADAHAKVIRLVRIDPLWIDVPLPEVRAEALSVGRKAKITYASGESISGEVVFRSAIVDPASGTLTVRVEAPNPKGTPVGKHVKVSFEPETPKPTAGAAKNVEKKDKPVVTSQGKDVGGGKADAKKG